MVTETPLENPCAFGMPVFLPYHTSWSIAWKQAVARMTMSIAPCLLEFFLINFRVALQRYRHGW